jgi:hypothetical protein
MQWNWLRRKFLVRVLSVIPFDTEEDATSIGNDTKYGLAAGIWTSDLNRAMRVSKRSALVAFGSTPTEPLRYKHLSAVLKTAALVASAANGRWMNSSRLKIS